MLNKKYSYQAFPYHGLSFKDKPASEFNDTEIVGSCFYQEWTEGEPNIVKDVFPDGMKGVVFIRCNFDNVYIPTGNKIEEGTHKKIQVQTDMEDWFLEDDLKPKEPMRKADYIRLGLSINPKDLPKIKMTESIIQKKERELLTSV